MGIDIGEAFSEGFSRTFAKNGVLLAAVFVAVGLLTLVLTQTLAVSAAEATLEAFQGLSPADLELTQQEYDDLVGSLEEGVAQSREASPFALGLPLGVTAVGLLVTALLAEVVSIVAIRVFASEETDAVPGEFVTDNILLATLNGFVGGIVVWGLVLVGLVLLIVPGVFLAVVFYFLRQEVALKDKNFVQAMADSWRLTKGSRFEVFAIGAILVVVSLLEPLVGSLLGIGSSTVGELVAVVVGGLLAVFGAAVVTRGYVQLDESDPDSGETTADPYDAALSADDIPE